MTEQDWLTCTDPGPMLAALGASLRAHPSQASERKMRLFGVACCRRIDCLLLKLKLAFRAVVIAERVADGHVVEEDVSEYRIRVNDEAFGWIDCWRTERENNFMYFAGVAAALALGDCRQERPGNLFDLLDCAPSAARAAAHWCRRNDRAQMSESVFRAMLAEQVPILRCIVGNPFRPVACDPSWRTTTAVGLAEAIYAERAFDRLPILADALEDAGCDNPDVLAHCRDRGPHARGCWVVDLILGKS
jgi:hypothetical protein